MLISKNFKNVLRFYNFMGYVGSYARFFIGLFLSLEVIRQLIMGRSLSGLATMLAVLFILLSIMFFVEKAVIR